MNPAAVPTIYFIGVSTTQSSIMRIFPRWADALGLGDAAIVGIDFRPGSDPAAYRRTVDFIKQDPLSLGALITTHKIAVYQACADLIDEFDHHARVLGEVSCLSKRGQSLIGSAKDPISSGLALDAILPAGFWVSGGTACLLGAGGAATAISWHLMDGPESPAGRPGRIVVTDRSPRRIEEIREVHHRLPSSVEVDYVLVSAPEETDRLLTGLPERSLIVNATGLGKDAPGSPVNDAVSFPRASVIWELNYRGDLHYLTQARAQAAQHGLSVHDGWLYFVHGWTRAIEEIFQHPIPVRGPSFEKLCALAQ
jgi:shikimate 5-dehydrogenase